MIGGDGTDTVTYESSTAGVQVDLASGRCLGGEAEGDTIETIENVIGSSHNDHLIGNQAANVLTGGLGNDTYVVGSGDVVVELAGGGYDVVETSINFVLSADAEIEQLTATGVANVSLTGNTLANTILGNSGANRIDGGSGADVMQGGAGDDIYLVDTLGDQVVEIAGGGTDTIQTGFSYTLGSASEIENLAATGMSAVSLIGNTAANTLTGNMGRNTINGGSGNDKLYGGLGNDQLKGGAGKDTSIFNTRLNKSANVDKLLDFKVRDDSVFLENAIFTKLGKGSAKGVKFKADMFTTGSKAQDAEDRIIHDKSKGVLYYDRDGTGSSAQVKIATLKKGLSLTHSDFFVI